jgi:phosphomannomutase
MPAAISASIPLNPWGERPSQASLFPGVPPAREPRTLDGIRIDWDDRWVLVRPSNTEPVLRVMAEAPTPAAAAELAEEFRAEVQAIQEA